VLGGLVEVGQLRDLVAGGLRLRGDLSSRPPPRSRTRFFIAATARGEFPTA